LTHKLESAWFQVISYQVISWFQNLPFKCNVHRYIVVRAEKLPYVAPTPEELARAEVGKYV
jgi:hypothetical protein